jgi:two-component system, chemotaxis family, sensor kinase CheA
MAADPYKYFRIEAAELLEQLGSGILELEKGGATPELTQRILRVAHTLKGAARVVKQPAIAEQAHALEELLQPLRETTTAAPREVIEGSLACVDRVSKGLAALAPAPVAPAPAANPTAGAVAIEPARAPRGPAGADDELRTVRADIGEMDELLEGIGETHTQLGAVGKLAGSVERARHLADMLVEQLQRSGGRDATRTSLGPSDKALALATELALLAGQLERQLRPSLEQTQRELELVRALAEQLRLVRAGTLFASLERTARDAAHELGKQAKLTTRGGDVRLDARVLEAVRGALVQLVRNALAHGVENPSERVAAGKPAAGNILIEVLRRGRRVVFRCKDDGRGVDLEAVRRSLERRGQPRSEIDQLGVEQLLARLLEGGISTSSSVTEVAGRGIGLDVVREAAARLGGNVQITMLPGQGTTFELSVPLSVASLDVLIVEAAGVAAAIPLDAVRRTLRVDASAISSSASGESITFDDRAIALSPLARALRREAPGESAPSAVRSVIVVEGSDGLGALGIDRWLGTATMVLRPLPEHAPADAIVAGVSVDADGNPQLVLDPDGLVQAARQRAPGAAHTPGERLPLLVIDDSMTTRMLEQSILESAGYEVDTASSAEEGLASARRRRYALFLVDVEMPGMDGFTFIETIRKDPDLRAIPAILVTSLSEPAHKQRGQDVGAQGYMVKSEFDQADLLTRIRRLVG